MLFDIEEIRKQVIANAQTPPCTDGSCDSCKMIESISNDFKLDLMLAKECANIFTDPQHLRAIWVIAMQIGAAIQEARQMEGMFNK